MAACAKDIRKISLELGGKSALIVFDDLDDDALARTVEWCARAPRCGAMCVCVCAVCACVCVRVDA